MISGNLSSMVCIAFGRVQQRNPGAHCVARLEPTTIPSMTTRIVALDTEVFHRHHFSFTAKRLLELRALVDAGHVKVVMADLAEREIRAGIHQRCKEVVALVREKRARDAFPILGSLPEYAPIIRLKDPGQVAGQVESTFNQFLSDLKIEIVPTGHIAVGPIIDKYFAVGPPFEANDEKRKEFPDAIAVAGLTAWATKHNSVVDVVSGDRGYRVACSNTPNLTPYEKVEDIFELVVKEVEEQKRLHMVERSFHALQLTAIGQIEEAFPRLEFSADDDQFSELYVENVSVRKVALGEPQILSIDEENSVELIVRAIVSFAAQVSFDDPAATYYDREDGRNYVFRRIRGEVRGELNVPVEFELLLDFEDPSRSDLRLEAINDDDQLDIDLSNLVEISSDNEDQI